MSVNAGVFPEFLVLGFIILSPIEIATELYIYSNFGKFSLNNVWRSLIFLGSSILSTSIPDAHLFSFRSSAERIPVHNLRQRTFRSDNWMLLMVILWTVFKSFSFEFISKLTWGQLYKCSEICDDLLFRKSAAIRSLYLILKFHPPSKQPIPSSLLILNLSASGACIA